MTDLSELIERVRQATGPDRRIDWHIADVTDHPSFEKRFENMWPPFGSRSKADRDIPLYTASIDAITALIEQKLSGANGGPLLYARQSFWNCGSIDNPFMETWNVAYGDPAVLKEIEAEGPTEALARCLAFLLALHFQEQNSDQ